MKPPRLGPSPPSIRIPPSVPRAIPSFIPILVRAAARGSLRPGARMLAVFSGEVVEVPAELVAAGSRTPSPKTKASELVARFLGTSCPAAVSVRLADLGHLAYSHANQALLRPRYCTTTYAAYSAAVRRREPAPWMDAVLCSPLHASAMDGLSAMDGQAWYIIIKIIKKIKELELGGRGLAWLPAQQRECVRSTSTSCHLLDLDPWTSTS
jgi:hypothetical protein